MIERMKNGKARFCGFGELAANLYPELTVANTEKKVQSQELVAELQRMQVDKTAYKGICSHHFIDQVAYKQQHLQLLADELYSTKLLEKWGADAQHAALIHQLSSILRNHHPHLVFNIVPPVALVFTVDGAMFPPLPPQYAFKGGVARKALAQVLKLNAYTHTARDLDVVCFGGRNSEMDYQILKTIMQDDWLSSYTPNQLIEVHLSTKSYFRTRELTINEVYLQGSHVIATAQCVCDMLSGVIRATAFHRRINRGCIESKIAAKAVRLYVEGEAEGREMRLDLLPKSTQIISHFHLALHLARARELGDAIALRYLEEVMCRKLSHFQQLLDLKQTIQALSILIDKPESFFSP